VQRMPRKTGALYPDGKSCNPSECRQPSERSHFIVSKFTRDEVVEVLEDDLGVGARCALYCSRHHGSRSLRYGAAFTHPANVGNGISIHTKPNGQLIPAKRIMPYHTPVGVRHHTKIARRPVVIEDQALVQLSDVGQF